MATAIRPRPLIYADLGSVVTEREGDRLELIDGVLYVTPAPRPAHQMVLDNLYFRLGLHVRSKGLGRVLTAPLDVRLSDTDVVQPDLLFISQARLSIAGEVAIDGAPDLVVEILSHGTRERDRGAKRDLYARVGVREYWLVDPRSHTIEVLSLQGGAYVAVPPDAAGVAHSALLPGLTLDPAAVFNLG
ncbi:MAG TPA: Uma2 family endonuclease, partial [Thermomicrobiales bacterium]|nr:Uma2 family endonuclease [Thermomicrobiales bacterium]